MDGGVTVPLWVQILRGGERVDQGDEALGCEVGGDFVGFLVDGVGCAKV